MSCICRIVTYHRKQDSVFVSVGIISPSEQKIIEYGKSKSLQAPLKLAYLSGLFYEICVDGIVPLTAKIF